jgi:hypothetical protein
MIPLLSTVFRSTHQARRAEAVILGARDSGDSIKCKQLDPCAVRAQKARVQEKPDTSFARDSN